MNDSLAMGSVESVRNLNGEIEQHLKDLGVFPGGNFSAASWISANGLIAGFSDNDQFDPVYGLIEVHPVLWRNGEIVDLGTLPGGEIGGMAGAVNNRGQVVGFALNTVPDPCSMVGLPIQTRAFLWQNGVMQDLGTLGGPDAKAQLINDAGQIAGVSYTESISPDTGCPEVHPFLWQNGAMLDLGTLGGTNSEVHSLNRRGQVVGNSTLAGDLTAHPFLWSKGQLTDLGTLGGDRGVTNWINDRGDIVGSADLPGPAPQLHHAFLWRNDTMIDLGVLPGDSCSLAYYVNSQGQVVGTSESRELCTLDEAVGEHAFLSEPGRLIVDLNTLIPPGARLDLTYAVAINDRGEIAGFGVPSGCAPQNYGDCGHAYVLIPCGVGEECVNTTLGADTPLAVPFLRYANPAGSHPANPWERFKNQARHSLHSPQG